MVACDGCGEEQARRNVRFGPRPGSRQPVCRKDESVRDIAAQPVQRVSIWDGVQGSFDSGENDQASPCRFQGGPPHTQRGAAAAARSGLRLN